MQMFGGNRNLFLRGNAANRPSLLLSVRRTGIRLPADVIVRRSVKYEKSMASTLYHTSMCSDYDVQAVCQLTEVKSEYRVLPRTARRFPQKYRFIQTRFQQLARDLKQENFIIT
jgi:hypothetical protein